MLFLHLSARNVRENEPAGKVMCVGDAVGKTLRGMNEERGGGEKEK